MKIEIRQPLTFSEIGRKDNQEDNVYPTSKELSTNSRFFILCDGMGGHDSGEVASDTVCRALGRYFETHLPADGMVTTDYFKQALEYAYDELDKKDTGALKKMGTTMTCLYLHSKGYLVAHIGDSRIYHVRPANTDLDNGRLGIIYQSSDHSLVNDLLKAGELTEEEALNFPQKNVITRAMQPNLERRYKADVFSFADIKAGDYFFLCSDGILEQLTNERLCEILASPTSDEEKLETIRQVCYDKTKDNYTCYLVPVDKVVVEGDDSHDSGDDIIAEIELECDATDSQVEVTAHSASQNIVSQPKQQARPTSPSQPIAPNKVLPWKGLLLIVFIIAAVGYAIVTLIGRFKSSNEQDAESPSVENVQRMKDDIGRKVRNVLEQGTSDETEDIEECTDMLEDVSSSDEFTDFESNAETTDGKDVEEDSSKIKNINTEKSDNTNHTLCTYNPTPSSKEENTESSALSVAEDSAVLTKQSM